MNRHTLKWLISEQDNGTLIREYLLQKKGLSNRLLIKAKQAQGAILVNGEYKTVRYQLKQGEELKIVFPPEKVSPYLTPEPLPLDIIYEDDDLLILNKPANMATMPSRNHPTGTLANRIIAYYKQDQLPFTVHVVTRLDKDTSGLVLVAKHQYSHSLLSIMQRQNQIERRYQAVVHGTLKNSHGIINVPIGRHPDSIIERIVTASGQTALTHYQVMKRVNNKTFVNIQLETGRTHQIRVHFAYLGHPLLGDTLYGGEQKDIKRQALHCSVIRFIHPVTKEIVQCHTPVTNDIRDLEKD